MKRRLATKPLHNLNRRLADLPGFAQILVAILLLSSCALADHYTGSEISLSITYLAPTALAAWYAGRRAGYFVAVTASVVWLYVDLLSGHPYSHPMIPIWNSMVRLGFFLIVTALLLHIRQLLTRLQDQAETDNLTGLHNSRSFYARLDLEHERALRYGHPFSIAYLDLDNFKSVNDTWGHETGDQVLQTIATSLSTGLRKTDCVARLGGDEFAILLAETGEKEAGEALRKLHAELNKQVDSRNWPIGFSIGAITCSEPGHFTIQELIRSADDLMYQIKRSGKNRVELCILSTP